ncbi:MAG: fused MFS/spermidine synthase [Deltaproteobacteria bacterium]|nr:fused MFS/spermidine synthase [Deltaproteobacteria bacterium]
MAIAALTLGAALLTVRVFPAKKVLGLIGGTGVLVLLGALPAWVPSQMHLGLFREVSPVLDHTYDGPKAFYSQVHASQILFSTDDPIMSVSVHSAGPSRRAIYNNGKSDSEIPGDNSTTVMLVLLPALFADEPKEAFIIGYGTGMSVGTLASLPSLERVVVAEISPGIMEAAPYFDGLNGDVTHNPKVEVMRSDAYRALLRSNETFDVIMSEPPNPWVTGVEMLYSQEFLTAARSRLNAQGVYAQWMHVYETDDATLELVMRTYLEVFERVSIWFVDINDYVILGFNDPAEEVPWEKIHTQFEEPAMREAFDSIGIHALPTLLAHERVPTYTLQHANLSGPIHTIEHPRISDLAARAFYTHGRGKFPFPLSREAVQAGQQHSSLNNYLKWRQAELTEEEWSNMANEICQSTPHRCAGVFTRWHKAHPNSQVLQAKLRSIEDNTAEGGSPREMIEIILALHEPDKIKGQDLSYKGTRAIQALYTRHFDYSAPFDSSILENAWSACSGDERCAEGLEAVRRTGGTSEPSTGN